MNTKLFDSSETANVNKVCKNINNPVEMPITYDMFSVDDLKDKLAY